MTKSDKTRMNKVGPMWPPACLKDTLKFMYLVGPQSSIPRVEDKLIEEMAELTQAILKRRNHGGSKYTPEELQAQVLEELSHVQIQLTLLSLNLQFYEDTKEGLYKEYGDKLEILYKRNGGKNIKMEGE